jgi:cytoskeletal protein RodZ
VSIGEDLAARRRRAGFTVGQVSQRTRIRETIITGIEGDDYSVCGGDFYARGHIRSIARAVGSDPEPLIREYDAVHRAPGALSAVSLDELAARATPPPSPSGRRRLGWAAVLGLAVLVVALGLVVHHVLSSPRQAASAAPAAGRQVVAHHRAGPGTADPATRSKQAATATSRGTVPVRALTPVSATAFGPYGAGQGDNPQVASLAIDRDRATAWRTDWYTTAQFGNLYPGTGLLLDMGRQVTITGVRISLGGGTGAAFKVRVGSAPALADLPPVAGRASATGTVHLRLASPAHGRYVLVWFTSLPADPAGTFQASVYEVSVQGRA